MKLAAEPTNLARGRQAEDLALRHLEAQGLVALSRNYRTRAGELDLVMREGSTLVFVEVRSRSNPYYGTAAESVGSRKQQRVIRAAQAYLQRNHARQLPACRFDVVEVSTDRAGAPKSLRWIRHAFEA